MSNMKQLGLGFQMYTQDYDERFPGAAQFQKWQNGGHWVYGPNNQPLTYITTSGPNIAGDPTGTSADVEKGALFGYIKNTQIYMCPSNKIRESLKVTYTMNCALAGATLGAVSESSSIVILDDEKSPNDGYFYAVNSPNSTDQLTDIHLGGGNLAYMDGHAKFIPFTAYPLDSSHGALKTRQTGAPRFYDPGLGPNGYNEGTPAFGTCGNPTL